MTSTLTPFAGPQAAFPLHPPAAWFDKPDWLSAGQKLTVVTDGPEAGRVAGYVAPFGQCILDGQPGCWTVPKSPTGYQAAHQGETLTAEGDTVRTANIGGGVNHARLAESFAGAVAHYDNTASQLMRVRYGEDDYGVWCAGAIWPDVTERDLAIIRASALSGDWRYRPELGAFDMTGSQLVNTPGFPHMRAASLDGGQVVITTFSGETVTASAAGACCDSCTERDARVADLQEAVAIVASLGDDRGLAVMEAAVAAAGMLGGRG